MIFVDYIKNIFKLFFNIVKFLVLNICNIHCVYLTSFKIDNVASWDVLIFIHFFPNSFRNSSLEHFRKGNTRLSRYLS